MSDSEGKQELSGIARSVDALFQTDLAADDPDAGPTEGEPPESAASGDPFEPAAPADSGMSPVPDEPPDPAMSPAPDELPDSAMSPAPDEPPVSAMSPAPDEPPPLPEPSEPGPADDVGSSLDDIQVVPLSEPEMPAEDDDPTPVPEVEPSIEDGGGSAAETQASVGADGDTPEATPLNLAVDAYLAGDAEKAVEIESLADEMLEQRRLDLVALSLARLAVAAGEPPDESMLQVARSIATPVVYGRLAGRIGAEHEETRLQEYFLACRNLGHPMAAAIRDHLAESTDRHARRIHCQALAEMGDAGRRMIEEMVDDENRFLARNAVAILGETGGDRAVELVTMALANPAALVRREALRSLAKLGDEESGELVVGLLDDSDADVRIQAAVTAGELHVERALRPILKLLDDASDPEELVPLIRALGHLGDPGAVPSIEPHVVPKLFSKPPTQVRIVGYRALHQIGTPHARELVEEAADDKEPEVRAAVREILGAR